MKDNCINCMYSSYSEPSIMINELMEDIHPTNYMVCDHQNSPYYKEFVDDNKVCRLYLDSEKYFLRKDRKEKIEKINKR